MKDGKLPSCVVVDDDESLTALLKDFFSATFDVRVFPTGEQALQFAEPSRGIDLVLCDLILPDMNGLDVVTRLKESGVPAPVIVITADESKDVAIEAVHRGAYDHVNKPLHLPNLKVVAERALRYHRLRREYLDLQEKKWREGSYCGLIGKSSKMRLLFQTIDKIAGSPSNVLITGESGSGKEMVARAIHAQGDRRDKPFIAINCSAIPKDLLESELFGHVKGAFTGALQDRKGLFEEAREGIVFLDEIGDMPFDLQAKLLRVLQERKIKPIGRNRSIEIGVRVLAAAHQDLAKMVREGKFRDDLYYRLNVIPLQVPALRERREDIPLLAHAFLEKFRPYNPTVETFSPEAMERMLCLRWTGNVRELENAVERAVMLCSSNVITADDISVETASAADQHISHLFTQLPTLRQLENEYIRYVLTHTREKKEETARILGVDRKTLYRKTRHG